MSIQKEFADYLSNIPELSEINIWRPQKFVENDRDNFPVVTYTKISDSRDRTHDETRLNPRIQFNLWDNDHDRGSRLAEDLAVEGEIRNVPLTNYHLIYARSTSSRTQGSENPDLLDEFVFQEDFVLKARIL